MQLQRWMSAAAILTAVAGLGVAGGAVLLPGERDLLGWLGLTLITAGLPTVVITQRRRAAAAATEESFNLGLLSSGPHLLNISEQANGQHGKGSTEDRALSRG